MKNRITHPILVALACTAVGCPGFVPPLSDAEQLVAGEATNTLLQGRLAYSRPYENASREELDGFYSGNSFFTLAWVEGTSSTSARDGLGPIFNARSCSACHREDGRGRPPEHDGEVSGFLVRVSDANISGGAPHPTLGGQLQPHAVQGAAGEADVILEYDDVEFRYPDGQTHILRRPSLTIQSNGNDLTGELELSGRVAPSVIGLGLLEAIDASDVLEAADENDANDDGISGRVSQVWSGVTESTEVGRFGWKGEKPTVADQNAGALAGDMGLTSSLLPKDDCMSNQSHCSGTSTEGDADIEVSDEVFDRLERYSQMLAPPVRVEWDTAELIQGRADFYGVGCASCHTPSHRTGSSHSIVATHNQEIWPYTDLLLHDMGDALSDGRPLPHADAAEWKTPPLWGMHATEAVSGHTTLLHDGRARNVEEAILWHGGEAQQAREDFAALDADARENLIRFVESL